MQGPLTVVGMKQFNDTVEGTHYDHTKLLVMLPFPRSRVESNMGFDVVETVFGKHDNYAKFKQFSGSFPIVLDCEYEITTKGIEIFEAKPKAKAA